VSSKVRVDGEAEARFWALGFGPTKANGFSTRIRPPMYQWVESERERVA